MQRELMIEQMNKAGSAQTPFLFVIDFLGVQSLFYPLDAEVPLKFATPLLTNSEKKIITNGDFLFRKHPIGFAEYEDSFRKVQKAIHRGDSFLTNLTFPTEIETDLSLEQIFDRSSAPYRLLVPGDFVCFSPECFVKIKDNTIFSYPMKGTIDASVPNATQLILEDEKEKAEHYTIVDLIRNDLSRVAKEVTVTKFRYIDEVHTHAKKLLQVSSEISGKLSIDWRTRVGEIIFSMLPAGSISGAPKDATINIIRNAEKDERGFYTGVFGVFDGESLDSAVIIRYIEEREGVKLFRSGGGITAKSDCRSEYQELIDKVYVSFT